MGKLLYISVFDLPVCINAMPDSQASPLSQVFFKDIHWFQKSLADFNRVVCFRPAAPITAEWYVDASLFALGGAWGQAAYHLPLPDTLVRSNISFLELLNVLVAIHVWGSKLVGKCIVIYCDNMAAVHTLTHYKITCPQLATVARNIWALQVSPSLHIEARHIAGCSNTLADTLSRIESPAHFEQFCQAHASLSVCQLGPDWCQLDTEI